MPCWLLKWRLLINCHCCLFSPSLSFFWEQRRLSFGSGSSFQWWLLPSLRDPVPSLLPSFFLPGLQRPGQMPGVRCLEWASDLSRSFSWSFQVNWERVSSFGEFRRCEIRELLIAGLAAQREAYWEGPVVERAYILLADCVFGPSITGTLLCPLGIFILLTLG